MRHLAVISVVAIGTLFAADAWSSRPVLAPETVSSPYFKVRLATARALTGRTDARSQRSLRRLASDAHPLVRLAALHAQAVGGGTAGRAAIARARRDPAPNVRAYAGRR